MRELLIVCSLLLTIGYRAEKPEQKWKRHVDEIGKIDRYSNPSKHRTKKHRDSTKSHSKYDPNLYCPPSPHNYPHVAHWYAPNTCLPPPYGIGWLPYGWPPQSPPHNPDYPPYSNYTWPPQPRYDPNKMPPPPPYDPNKLPHTMTPYPPVTIIEHSFTIKIPYNYTMKPPYSYTTKPSHSYTKPPYSYTTKPPYSYATKPSDSYTTKPSHRYTKPPYSYATKPSHSYTKPPYSYTTKPSHSYTKPPYSYTTKPLYSYATKPSDSYTTKPSHSYTTKPSHSYTKPPYSYTTKPSHSYTKPPYSYTTKPPYSYTTKPPHSSSFQPQHTTPLSTIPNKETKTTVCEEISKKQTGSADCVIENYNNVTIIVDEEQSSEKKFPRPGYIGQITNILNSGFMINQWYDSPYEGKKVKKGKSLLKKIKKFKQVKSARPFSSFKKAKGRPSLCLLTSKMDMCFQDKKRT